MGFQMPNFDDPHIGADDDEDDDALEDELRQIQQEAGGRTTKRAKANQKKPGLIFYYEYSGKNECLMIKINIRKIVFTPD
jgi:hypothetical protein